MRTALTIAGSDSGAGAGIQADLKTFAAFGLYGTSAITAVTVQSTLGVDAVAPLSADLVTAQIEAVAGDITIHATKIGMLATSAIVEAVVAAIEELDLPLVVVDPVMRLKERRSALLDADGMQALRVELLPLARVVTPNIPEAEMLSGMRIGSLNDAREAARRIRDMGAAAVVITGGHAAETYRGSAGRAEGSAIEIVDLLLDGDSFHEFRTPRIDTANTHGTGCTFASAVAACLGDGPRVAGGSRSALSSTLPAPSPMRRRLAMAVVHSIISGSGGPAETGRTGASG